MNERTIPHGLGFFEKLTPNDLKKVIFDRATTMAKQSGFYDGLDYYSLFQDKKSQVFMSVIYIQSPDYFLVHVFEPAKNPDGQVQHFIWSEYEIDEQNILQAPETLEERKFVDKMLRKRATKPTIEEVEKNIETEAQHRTIDNAMEGVKKYAKDLYEEDEELIKLESMLHHYLTEKLELLEFIAMLDKASVQPVSLEELKKWWQSRNEESPK
jgi:hypothetical protein